MQRLVRALLGKDAVSEKKCASGNELLILGVVVAPGVEDYQCMLAEDKARKCLSVVDAALRDGLLYPGAAQKLAGCACVFAHESEGVLVCVTARQTRLGLPIPL